ncbi:hypothetical protein J2T60_002298 [Natronospira proteinivora]|uniref:Uncharacterized protein n=1 Tax=Natronospira proteinivora TaxID=1807133 RepID=A0ABT1GD50_9GAMM|nr:hypothetical protein [Natronospira proteinivora]MCP1728298.1 hypothetical protein [Natronospira proteinivora]
MNADAKADRHAGPATEQSTPQAPGYSPEELEHIVRRAAELQSADGDGALGTFSEAEVIRIAEDVGLAPEYVRRALREMQCQVPEAVIPDSHPLLDRLLGETVVRVERSLPMSAGPLQEKLEAQLKAEGLQAIRQGGGLSVWEPSGDLAGIIERSLDFSGRRYRLAGAESISLSVIPLETGYSRVTLFADISNQRKDYLGGWGGALFVLLLMAWGFIGVMDWSLGGWLMGLTGLAGLFLAIFDTRRSLVKHRKIYSLVLEGILDRVRL